MAEKAIQHGAVQAQEPKKIPQTVVLGDTSEHEHLGWSKVIQRGIFESFTTHEDRYEITLVDGEERKISGTFPKNGIDLEPTLESVRGGETVAILSTFGTKFFVLSINPPKENELAQSEELQLTAAD